MRVRGFTQDDAHIFCRPDQLEDEILRVLDFTTNILRDLRLRALRHLPLDQAGEGERHRRAVGGRDGGARARRSRRAACAYEVDPGEGVFYGPKIDIKIKDSLEPLLAVLDDPGRLPQPDPLRARVHRRGRQGAPAGHGAPRAARQPGAVLRGADRALRGRLPAVARAGAGRGHPGHREAAGLRPARWARSSRRLGVRVQVDDRNEKLGYRIREAQVQKVPYMLVVGDKEVEAKSVSVRHRQAGDLGPQDVAAFGARVVRLPGGARDPGGSARSERRRCLNRQQDGPHQRPHPGEGSPGDRRGRRRSSGSCRPARR